MHISFQDRFGHLVLMDVMEHGTQDVVRDLAAKLRKRFATLSMDKFAHDVVMALMVKDREECLPQIVNDIIQSPDLKIVRLHPYGQLVLQHAEKYLVETDHKTLKIRLLADDSQSHHDGKNVRPTKKKKRRNHV